MKPAVVLALPGTSSEEAAGTLRHMAELFDRRFAGVRRRWAYTSSGVRRKLAQSGKPVAGPAEVLAGLRDEGVTHVAVKSLHLAAGMEYTELSDLAQDSRGGPGGFERIVISAPLLDTPADFERTIRCLLMSRPAGTDEGEALLLVAHGSRRPEAQVTYAKAAAFCRRLDSFRGIRVNRRVLLGTLMSHPGLEDVLRECKAAGLKKLVLAPLMIVAGSSARNELAGGNPAAWVSVLAREGIRSVPLIKGLGDYNDIVRIWLDDIERMLRELAEPNGPRG